MPRVLYVDDEADIREIVQMALELDPSIDLRLCASGAEALALQAQGAAPPDLLLLDMMMPDMDGPTTLGRLREDPAWGEAPAIFITARAQSADRERLLALGAAGVVVKPFDPMTLARELMAFLPGDAP